MNNLITYGYGLDQFLNILIPTFIAIVCIGITVIVGLVLFLIILKIVAVIATILEEGEEEGIKDD